MQVKIGWNFQFSTFATILENRFGIGERSSWLPDTLSQLETLATLFDLVLLFIVNGKLEISQEQFQNIFFIRSVE